jgi:hypothetical protein
MTLSFLCCWVAIGFLVLAARRPARSSAKARAPFGLAAAGRALAPVLLLSAAGALRDEIGLGQVAVILVVEVMASLSVAVLAAVLTPRLYRATIPFAALAAATLWAAG